MEEKKTLKEGEIICPKCEGKGCFSVPGEPELLKACSKCLGAGILDWIEAIVGKVRRRLKAKWTVDVSKDIKAFYHEDLERELMEKISNEIANDIDKEIMDKIFKESNKLINKAFYCDEEEQGG